MATRMRGLPLALMASVVAILPVKASLPSCIAFFGVDLVHSAPGGQDEELLRKGYFGVRLALLSDEIRAREQLGTRPAF
jgi:hypothetical protein